MDLLQNDVGKLFRKFFFTSFMSSIVSSIYTLVDMAVIGQYHGPDGSAAMALIAPSWNLIFSTGMLVGIGSSVLYAIEKGKGSKKANEYFSAAILLDVVIIAIIWSLFLFFEDELLILFGADEALLPLCKQYLFLPRLLIPFFSFSNILTSFLRNDSDPQLAATAMSLTGILNIFGDYFFVFTLDMGIMGAGIATAISMVISDLIMLYHFFSKKNTLSFIRPANFFKKAGEIIKNGFSSFVVDMAMGVMTIVFNRVIMNYLDSTALAVYGVIVSLSTLVQCSSYGIGQAAQPIVSQNFGAGQNGRVKEALKHGIITSFIMAGFWFVVSELFPQLMVSFFMDATPEVLAIAPAIIRVYAISFILLPFNILTTFYFQALGSSLTALIISLARGMVIGVILVEILPLLFDADSIWWAMVFAETFTMIYACICMKKQPGTLK